MASNPISGISTADNLNQVLKTVTDAALFIEQMLAASGVNGFDAAGAEQLTAAFSNLATIAIQAAHDAAGVQITPGSVMALMPVSTPLAIPGGK
ncbi:MAG TPA: hypothetical protein VGN44_10055 [Candidatus Angelobacter sp.]